MIGTTIRHYHIIEKCGAGGMGVVYKAQDVVLRRSVALKFLPADFGDDDERRARFQREARLAAALNHPNICTVYEVGKIEAADACTAADESLPVGTPFIAMEFVDGEMLATRLARVGKFSTRGVLDVAVQIASGLAEAHANHIVHRDLKPQNVMITAGGRVKMLDFGLAKPLDAVRGADSMLTTATLKIFADTAAGSVLGTVAYMSPEQALGKPADARSDVFAFGIMLYELITGRRPFLADSATATLAKILEAEPPAEATTDVPPDLMQIVRKCLQKKPADRYARTDDLLSELERVRGRVSAHSTPILDAVRRPWSQDADARPLVKRRGALWLALLLLLVVGPVWYIAGRRSDGGMRSGTPAPGNGVSALTGTDAPARTDAAGAAPVPPPTGTAPAPEPVPQPAPIQPKTLRATPAAAPALPAAASPPSNAAAQVPTLALSSSPRASIMLDGDLVGVSPVTLETKPGTHDVVMTSPEGLRWRGRIEIAPGEKKNVHRDLNARGSLTITADTWVEISLDGGALEQTPIHLSQVAAGLHELHAARDGYLPQVVEVTIEEGRTTRLHLKLEKKP